VKLFHATTRGIESIVKEWVSASTSWVAFYPSRRR
jgi:hypothetical protein